MNKDTAWFEELYKKAEEDHTAIPWAKLAPNPFLVEYLQEHRDTNGKKALVVGCGLGDDAKALCDAGFEVTAIDISESAIKWANKRFTEDNISFEIADVLELDAKFKGAFDFVFEALTIQSLPIAYRPNMIESVASTVADGGALLVVAHGRNEDDPLTGPPWPLLINELKLFKMHGLREIGFSIYDDPSGLASLRFRALYHN